MNKKDSCSASLGTPSSGDVETESSGKGVWYPEERDRDIWSG